MKRKNRNSACCLAVLLLTGIAFIVSLSVGRYPISWSGLRSDPFVMKVFLTLRLPRALMALASGICLGIAGSVYQTVFQNPLASPDIIGVASGSSVGAAAAILFFGGGSTLTTLCAFSGGCLAVLLALLLAMAARQKGISSLVLAGIVVNALTQAVLMLMKMAADPEKELASIEFWTMGSFAGVTLTKLTGTAGWMLLGLAGLFLLNRQILLLGLKEEDAKMLGVPVGVMRGIILGLSTLIVGAVVSVTGLISFVGLLAPHTARLLSGDSRSLTLSGLCGGCLLLCADILSRSLIGSELPVSIITSLIGAPFLFCMLCIGGNFDG